MTLTQERVTGGIAAILYLILLLLILVFLKVFYQKPPEEPAPIEILFEAQAGARGMPAAANQNKTPSGGSSNAAIVTNDKSDISQFSGKSQQVTDNTPTDKTNKFTSMIDDAVKKGQQAGKSGTGDDPNHEGEGKGEIPCKGCKGSGTSLDGSDMAYFAKPQGLTPQDAKVKLKLEVDKNGEVLKVFMIDAGAATPEAIDKCKEAAKKIKYKEDPTANTVRIAYVTYDLMKG